MTIGSKSVRGGRMGTRAKRLSAPWLAFLSALLLAFLSQSIITQTHQHWDADAATVTATAGDAADGHSDKQSPADLPSHCPICRVLAHSGAALLPTPVAPDAPARVDFFLATTLLVGLALARRSHAWQSRAPPLRLRA